VTTLHRVLVVEDHHDTLRLLCRLLAHNGWIAQGASNCADAVLAAQGNTFDVAILDMHLPDGDGWDLLGRLRVIQPDLCAIAISGLSDPIGKDRATEAGFKAYVHKPFSLAKLLDQVRLCAASPEEENVRR